MKICMRCNASWNEEDQARYGLCDACMAAVYARAETLEENAANSAWTAMRLLSVRSDAFNSWTPEEIREEYERRRKVVLSRFSAQAERAKAEENGGVHHAAFWHRGFVFHGTAQRSPDGTWSFRGAQDRTFVGRKAKTLTVTGMTKFNPQYSGKHTVEKTGGVAVVE